MGKNARGKIKFFYRSCNFFFGRICDNPPLGKAVGRHVIQEREGGVVTVYDNDRISYLEMKLWIDFEVLLNNLCRFKMTCSGRAVGLARAIHCGAAPVR